MGDERAVFLAVHGVLVQILRIERTAHRRYTYSYIESDFNPSLRVNIHNELRLKGYYDLIELPLSLPYS